MHLTRVWVSRSVMSDSLQPPGLYSPPGSSVHRILQARILEWVAISFSRGSSRPTSWTLHWIPHCRIPHGKVDSSSFNFIFKLYIIVLVLPNIKMNPSQVYMCSPSWTLLPPHTIPLGRPSALAPSIQYRASNLDWHLVSYMILRHNDCLLMMITDQKIYKQ